MPHESQAIDNQAGLFFRTWLRKPLHVAAYGPSGPALSRAVAEAASVLPDGPVVELGAGTGALTGALADAGVTPDRMILFESDPGFVETLRTRFPGARIVSGDAYQAVNILGSIGAAAVVSGLPLVQHPRRSAFVHDCLCTLARPGARFVQITYLKGSPVPMEGLNGVAAHCSPTIWSNFPPARVWSYWLERTAALQPA